MTEEGKIRDLSKMVVQALYARRHWIERRIYNFAFSCRESLRVVGSVLKMDWKMFNRHYLFDADVSDSDFGDLEDLTRARVEIDDKIILQLDKILKALNLIHRTNNFAQRYMEWPWKQGELWEGNTAFWEGGPAFLESAESFYNAGQRLIREIQYYSLDGLSLSWPDVKKCSRDEEKYPSSYLAELISVLEDIRTELLWETEACGPYVVFPGDGWAAGLGDDNIEGRVGLLSVALDQAGKVRCGFEWEMAGKVQTVSWALDANRFTFHYDEELFRTWAYDSGKLLEHPITESKAHWAVRDKSYIVEWLSLLDTDIPHLLESTEYNQLAKTVKETLEGRGSILPWSNVRWTIMRELESLISQVAAKIDAIGKPASNGERKRNEETVVRPPRKPQLNATQEMIIDGLGRQKLTGEEIAQRAGCKMNSNFKTALSVLRRIGVLGNEFPNGYFLKPNYYHLLKQSD